jgi:hypothetical protein
MVKAMAAYGIPPSEIGLAIGVSAPTVRKYFWREIEVGAVEANARVAESLYKKACGEGQGSVTAAIFWLKARAGWLDQPTLPPGKKEQAMAEAAKAGEDGDWGTDLSFGDVQH